MKMSLIDNAKKGKWNGGIVCGYDVVEGQLFINEDEAEIVKKIYDLYIWQGDVSFVIYTSQNFTVEKFLCLTT